MEPGFSDLQIFGIGLTIRIYRAIRHKHNRDIFYFSKAPRLKASIYLMHHVYPCQVAKLQILLAHSAEMVLPDAER